MLGFRHRLERAAELDDVPVAVVPVLEQLEIIPDFVDRHRTRALDPAPYIGSRSDESELVAGLFCPHGIGRYAPLRHGVVRRQRVARGGIDLLACRVLGTA